VAAIRRAALAATFSVVLAGCSGGAAPAAAPAATTGSAQAAPTVASASAALIVGALPAKPFSGLAGSIGAIRFSPDGKILAAGGQDPFVQLWDVSSGQALRTLKSPADTRDFNLRTIAFSPDGTRVAKDGPPLVVWDVASGKPLFEKWVFNSADSGGGAAAIAFSPDGKILAAGDAMSLQLLDASTGTANKVLVDVKGSTQSAATAATRGLAFSPDGLTLASAGPANVVTLWTVSSGQQAATLTGTATQINGVAFSPDGKYLAGGGQDDITIWELPGATASRTLVHESNQHSAFNSVAFSADGKYLAGTSIMGLDLWTVATWQAVPITTTLNQGVRDAFALSPDTQLLAGVASGQDHVVRAWPLQPAPVTGAAAAPAAPVVAKPGTLDVCTLVTQVEAEAMLGAPVTSNVNRPMACRYTGADGSTLGVDSAGGASADFSKLMFDTTHQGAPAVKDISGLGDKAFSTGTDDFCCALYVLKGSTLFEVLVQPFDRGFQNGAPTDKLLSLANKAASRL
jgi:dipeptidyl aminopeptidase/acylaminoacyl peptidase